MLLLETISQLSHEQRAELYRRQIRPGLLGDWKAGRRLPTEVQVADLADVTGTDWAELQREVTLLRAPATRRDEIAKALHWHPRSSSKV